MAKFVITNKTVRGIVGVGSEKIVFNEQGVAVTESEAVAEALRSMPEVCGYKVFTEDEVKKAKEVKSKAGEGRKSEGDPKSEDDNQQKK